MVEIGPQIKSRHERYGDIQYFLFYGLSLEKKYTLK